MKQVVYIVGAGLTKALERPGGPKVPLMNDFTWVLADRAGDDDVGLTTLCELVNVLGWPVPEEISTLARELGGGESRTPERRQALARYIKSCPAENIEDLILRAGEESEAVQDRFVFAISRLFHSIGGELNLEPLARFVSHQHQLPECQHTVISFNYDLGVESVLASLVGWDARSGYGVPVSYRVEASALATHEDQFPKPGEGANAVGLLIATRVDPPSTASCPWVVLKPHGSFNWLAARRDPTEEIVLVCDAAGNPAYPRDAGVTTLMCGGVHFMHPSVLVLPPGAKHRPSPFRERIAARQKEALQHADDLFVIGWSLPQTDAYETSLLRVIMADRQIRPSLTVINYRADRSYFERVSDVFGIDRTKIDVFNNGFLQWVKSQVP